MAPARKDAMFRPGDKVIRNPRTWIPNDFDSWGRGLGVGIVVEPPFPLAPHEVDVRWPAGRCFEFASGLLPYEENGRSAELEASNERGNHRRENRRG